MFDVHAGYVVLIAGAITGLLRFIPFIAFATLRPGFILYLGRVLPYAVMAMLAVYCLRAGGGGAGATVPKILASLTVIVLHVWRRNTLLSTLAGTGLYMFLVQCVF